MNWTLLFIVIAICIILLIICYVLNKKLMKQNKHDKTEKRCMNCHNKQYEDMMDIRGRNKRSKHYGTMVDDYAVCDRWKGDRGCRK